jgi:hypothetical protein
VAEIAHEKKGYEKQDINVAFVIGVAVFIIIILIGILIVLNDYFVLEKEKVVYDSLLKPESSALREIRASEAEVLNSFRVLDTEKGIYQIPIERAMQLLAEESFQQKLVKANNPH